MNVYRYNDYGSDLHLSCEAVVVGSGAGGAVAAAGLAEAGHDVIIAEEGSWYTREHFNCEPSDMVPMMYRGAGSTLLLGIPPVSVTLGRCVGGTTTINSATCFRLPERVAGRWRDEFGCADISHDELTPLFDELESDLSIAPLTDDLMSGSYRVVKRGADALGWSCKPLKHNVKGCEGLGVCQYGCPTGAKQSADVFHVPAAISAGARLLTNCRVERILVADGRATGVEGRVVDPATRKPGHRIRVDAGAVIIACGSLLTPALLAANGLGGKSGSLGRNLTVHPAGRLVAVMDEVVDGFRGVSQDAYIDDFADEGIMLEGIFVPPGLMMAILPGIGPDHEELISKYRRTAAFGFLVSDESRGRVLQGRFGQPFLSFYNLGKRDAARMKQGIARCARIFLAAGSREVYTGLRSIPLIRSEADVEKLLECPVPSTDFNELMAFHPLGTCRFGPDPAEAVLDQNLESFNVRGLFVADGSIFPTSLGVNPMVTIMAFALRTARYISSERQRFFGSAI